MTSDPVPDPNTNIFYKSMFDYLDSFIKNLLTHGQKT